MINVFHEGILPSTLLTPTGPVDVAAEYRIRVLDCSCDVDQAIGLARPLPITTAGYGDVVKDLATMPRGAANDSVDVVDALAIIERFASVPGSTRKARADLEPNCLDLIINVSDVLHSIAAFSGLVYPLPPNTADPCDSPCSNPLPN